MKTTQLFTGLCIGLLVVISSCEKEREENSAKTATKPTVKESQQIMTQLTADTKIKNFSSSFKADIPFLQIEVSNQLIYGDVIPTLTTWFVGENTCLTDGYHWNLDYYQYSTYTNQWSYFYAAIKDVKCLSDAGEKHLYISPMPEQWMLMAVYLYVVNDQTGEKQVVAVLFSNWTYYAPYNG